MSLKCTKSVLCSNTDRHRGRCNRKLDAAQHDKICKTICKTTCKRTCKRTCKTTCKTTSKTTSNTTRKTTGSKKKNADDPWYINVQNSEHNRLKLFGIRIQFTKKIKKRIERQNGTVVAYLPATQEPQLDQNGMLTNITWPEVPE